MLVKADLNFIRFGNFSKFRENVEQSKPKSFALSAAKMLYRIRRSLTLTQCRFDLGSMLKRKCSGEAVPFEGGVVITVAR